MMVSGRLVKTQEQLQVTENQLIAISNQLEVLRGELRGRADADMLQETKSSSSSHDIAVSLWKEVRGR